MLNIAYVSYLILAMSLVSFSQAWTKIKLLESNRADVEKILGKPLSLIDYFAKYETKDYQIGISYSDGICNYNFPTDFKAPEWTVKFLTLTPKKKTKLKKVVKDKSILSIMIDGKDSLFYEDKAKNIVYDVKLINKIEYLQSMQFEPDVNRKDLVCLWHEENCFKSVGVDFVVMENTYKKGDIFTIGLVIDYSPQKQFEYTWGVSEGEIIDGQNTEWIKIDTSKIKGNSFTVKLVVKAKLPDSKFCLKIKEVVVNLQN